MCVLNRRVGDWLVSVSPGRFTSYSVDSIDPDTSGSRLEKNKNKRRRLQKANICPSAFHSLHPRCSLKQNFNRSSVELMDYVALGKSVLYGWVGWLAGLYSSHLQPPCICFVGGAGRKLVRHKVEQDIFKLKPLAVTVFGWLKPNSQCRAPISLIPNVTTYLFIACVQEANKVWGASFYCLLLVFNFISIPQHINNYICFSSQNVFFFS